jgi:hypothetical protein
VASRGSATPARVSLGPSLVRRRERESDRRRGGKRFDLWRRPGTVRQREKIRKKKGKQL